jgi:hypothetical protein
MSPTPSLLNRIRSEFIEMPGLRLRIEQAQRLWNLDRLQCERVLQSLVETNFLRQYQDNAYSRV